MRVVTESMKEKKKSGPNGQLSKSTKIWETEESRVKAASTSPRSWAGTWFLAIALIEMVVN